MKKLGLYLLPLFAVSASADLTIVQKLESMGNSTDMTIKIKGDKIRMDPSPEMSTVVDNKSGEIIRIMHAQKAFIVVPGERSKQMIPQSTEEKGGKTASAPEPKATGEKGKIKMAVGEFEAEKFTCEISEGMKVTFWVLKDYPNWKSISEQMSRLGVPENYPDMSKLPGFPVRIIGELGGKASSNCTVISISEDAIPNDQFETPAGYTQMETSGEE